MQQSIVGNLGVGDGKRLKTVKSLQMHKPGIGDLGTVEFKPLKPPKVLQVAKTRINYSNDLTDLIRFFEESKRGVVKRTED